jgi:hypothetical protein
MTRCDIQHSGALDLYFYGEITPFERRDLDTHLAACAECREALDELRTIRSALAPAHAAAGPPEGDWTSLMARIERGVSNEPSPGRHSYYAAPRTRRTAPAYVAMAALIALVTASVTYVARDRARAPQQAPGEAAERPDESIGRAPVHHAAALPHDGFAAVSEQHFDRSKLVILGLASRHPKTSSSADWAYERQLAGTLLDDTRLYKQAAEARGLGSLAGVMSDLELVLLQTSLSHEGDDATLDRLQRLIQKRDLVSKMEMTF